MIEVILLVFVVTVIVGFVVRTEREEARKTERWIAALRAQSSVCPACQPFGGYWLGAMRPDGSYEIIDCDLCGGTGRLPE